MKRLYSLLFLAMLSLGIVNAQDWVFAKQFASTGAVTLEDSKIDGDGNIYIVGNYINALTVGGLTPLPYSDATGKEDIFICKFNVNGTAIWAKQIASNNRDLVGGLAIDPGNNIYVVGSYQGDVLTFQGESTDFVNTDPGKYDSFIAKYNSDGTLLTADSVFWGSDVQRLRDITYDYTKNLLAIVGMFQAELRYDSSGAQVLTALSDKDLFVSRFDPDLNFIDKLVFNGTVKQYIFKNVNICVIADTVNSYFLTGDLVGDLLDASSTVLLSATESVNMDIMVVKVTDGLAYSWGRKGGGVGSFEHINSSGSDKFGNIYFTGKAQSASIRLDSTATLQSAPRTSHGAQDYLIAKYNRNGNLQWFNRVGHGGVDNAYGLAVRNRRILYTGNIDHGGNVSSGFAVYDIDGNLIVTDSITGDGTESGLNVAFDLTGDSTFVIGTYNGDSLKAGPYKLLNTAPGTDDGFLVKYGFQFKIFLENKVDVKCYGESTGSIEVGSEFGTPPITYEWTPNVSSTSLAENLDTGFYQIIATGAGGRKDTMVVEITQPEPIMITEDGITPTSCNVVATSGTKNDGGISLTVTEGNGPYSYLWSGGSGFVQGQQDQTTLTAATYFLTVTDANTCVKLDTFIVTEPSQTGYEGSIVENITIPPGSNGAVRLNTYGGTPGYTFSWQGPPGFIPSTEDTIENLEYGGDYDLQVTDANSCTFDTTFVVEVDTGLIITICDYQDVSCKDDEDGSAQVCVVSGGSGSYSYAWRKASGTPVGINSNMLQDVPAGTYIVKVTDLVSMKTAETSQAIAEPANFLSIGPDSTWLPSCPGDADGAIFISITGGWGGYTYLWTPGFKTDQDLYNVMAGMYTVQVSDTGLNSGTCVKQLADIPLTEPPLLTVSILPYQDISCFDQSDGGLKARATGGTPPYIFLWDDPGAQDDSIATSLSTDNYTVIATDSKGCIANDNDNLSQPAALMIGSVDKMDPTWSVLADGSITVNASGGTRDYMFALNSGSSSPDSVFSNRGVGTDTVWVDDMNNCGPVSTTVTLSAPDPDPISLTDTNIVNVLCKGDNTGSVCVTPTGGIGSFFYTWTGSAVTDSCLDMLIAGTYMVTITDNLSDTLMASIEVTEPASGIIYDAVNIVDSDNDELNNGSIEITVSGGTPDYSYFLEDALQSGNLIENLGPGSYTIRVDDAGGCSSADSMVEVGDLHVFVPDIDGFSNILLYPNPSKGKFTIELNNEKSEDLMLEIVNMTGQMVYQKLHKFNGNTRFIETIDLGEQARGTYFLRVNGLPVKAKLMIE